MPRLTIDLAKVRENTVRVAEILQPHGVQLAGVTKGCLGSELIAEAMLEGGAASLADSHMTSVNNLRQNFPESEIKLLRSPVDGSSFQPAADYYFVSSCKQAKALLKLSAARPLRLCLLIETGDRREGVPTAVAVEEAESIAGLEDAELSGLATNAACADTSAPLDEALAVFSRVVEQVHWRLKLRAGQSLPVVSAGGSGLLALLAGVNARTGEFFQLFDKLTELRVGEAILLGRIPSGEAVDLYLPEAHRDAFLLEGTVLEVFGKAGHTQALVDFGVQDVGSAALVPGRAGITLLGASSDYLTLSCDAPGNLQAAVEVGDRIGFIPSYYALLAAMTSPFVEKQYLGLDA